MMKSRTFITKYFEKLTENEYCPKSDDTLLTIFTYHNPNLWSMWESNEFEKVRRLERSLAIQWCDLIDQSMDNSHKSYKLNEKQIKLVIKCMKKWKKNNVLRKIS